MGFDNSGIYSRPNGEDTWQKDAAAGVKIEADLHDANDTDMARALSLTIMKTGKSIIETNIPWNGKKITNVGSATADTDVPQYVQVQNWKDYKTGTIISGSDSNGRITFSKTGVNGLNWTVADLSWLGKPAEAGKSPNRLVMNDSGTANSGLVTGGSGSDVFIIDETGRVNNNGQLTNNLSHEGANWRVISAGYGSLLSYSGGDFSLSSNDAATATNPYVAATLRTFFQALNSAGSSEMRLIKSASGKTSSLRGMVGTELRWQMQLGDTAAESGTAVGSDFYLSRYNNSGVGLGGGLHINRNTAKATFYGDITTIGEINTDSVIRSTDTTMIIATAVNGNIYLRVNGSGNATEQAVLNSNGDWVVEKDIYAGNGSTGLGGGTYLGLGMRSKAGQSGSYTATWLNLYYASGFVYVYAGTTNMGKIQWQAALLDAESLTASRQVTSTWDAVRALNPVSYEQDGTERWGFTVQETQPALRMAVPAEVADEAPTLDQTAVIAVLTKALQEAMSRIEALEAAK